MTLNAINDDDDEDEGVGCWPPFPAAIGDVDVVGVPSLTAAGMTQTLLIGPAETGAAGTVTAEAADNDDDDVGWLLVSCPTEVGSQMPG